MNKNEERYYLEMFLDAYEIRVNEISESESPDFLLDIDGEVTGVEIVTLRQKNKSGITGDHRKIARKAQEIAIKNGMPPVEVHFGLSDNKTGNTQRYITETAEQLYEIIDQNLNMLRNANGNIVRVADNVGNIGLIYAHWNSTNAHQWLDNHRWTVESAGFVTTQFADIIQNEISKKNTKLIRYLGKCEKCWLLMVIDRLKHDGHLNYSYMDNDIKYTSKFSKAFVFDLLEKNIYELNTV